MFKIFASFFFAIIWSHGALSATWEHSMLGTSVKRTVVTDPSYSGGCAVQFVADAVAASGGNCSAWLTPDCTASSSALGSNVTKTSGKMHFDQAVAAYALGKRVNVYFTDDYKISNRCVITQIDMYD